MKSKMAAGRLILLAGTGLGACSGPAINNDSKNSFLNADDLIHMTDRMSVSMASNADVARVTAQKPMVIVMRPIVNDTNEIIPAREKQMYVARVRVQLSSKPLLADRFTWVLNRTDYEAACGSSRPCHRSNWDRWRRPRRSRAATCRSIR